MRRVLAILVGILKNLPLKRDITRKAPSVFKVEELDDGDNTSTADDIVDEVPFLEEKAGKAFLKTIITVITSGSADRSDDFTERVSYALDCLSTFLSDLPDYMTLKKRLTIAWKAWRNAKYEYPYKECCDSVFTITLSGPLNANS